MKLTDEEIKYIETVTRTANLFGIENVIIDDEGMRGLNDGRTVYIRQDVNKLPPLSFDAICISRVPLFVSRLEIAKTQEKFQADATLHADGWVQCVTFKGKGTKIEYRGNNPTKVKIPKDLNDERTTQIRNNAEVVVMMQKGQAAMSADVVNIISNDEVTFEFFDVNKDVFSCTFPDKAEALTDADITKFAHKYPSKLILTLFKKVPDGCFSVGGRVGTLSSTIEGIEVHIIPQK